MDCGQGWKDRHILMGSRVPNLLLSSTLDSMSSPKCLRQRVREESVSLSLVAVSGALPSLILPVPLTLACCTSLVVFVYLLKRI